MLYKGKVPQYIKEDSNMRRVLAMLEKGYQDRAEIAALTNLTQKQVTAAIWNLSLVGLIEVHRHLYGKDVKGRKPSIYRLRGVQLVESDRRPMANISFIFWAGNKGGKGTKT